MEVLSDANAVFAEGHFKLHYCQEPHIGHTHTYTHSTHTHTHSYIHSLCGIWQR